MTNDENFIKIRLELCDLLLNMDDKIKKNVYILQLETLIEAIKKDNMTWFKN